jgi:hypothetical protein
MREMDTKMMTSGRKVGIGMRIVSLLVIGALLSSISSTLTSASAAQDLPQPTERQIIDASVSGPAFLNAYWVNRGTGTTNVDVQKEVGPGDGASTLAVVIVNRGFSAITSVTGSLHLPEGFSSNGRASSTDTAIATFDSTVDAGQTFILYFDLNVSNNTHVGAYNADLNVEYQRLLEAGSPRNNQMTVPFRLTGKVILDPVAVTHNLVPGVSNNVDIAIRNTGSAPATGIIVSIIGITINGGSTSTIDSSAGGTIRPQITNFGTNTFTVGTITARSNTTLTTTLFPNISAGGNTAGIQLQITYNDATGNSKTITSTMGVIVLQNAPSVIGVTASSSENETDNRIVAGKADNFVLEIANKGTSKITNAVVTMESSSASLNILGDSKWAVDEIAPGSKAKLETQVFASTSLIGNPATFDVTIDYILDGSPKTEKYILGTYVDGIIALRVYDLSINYVGATPTLVGNILNEGNTAAFFTTVELVKGLGDNQSALQGNFNGTGQFIRQQRGNSDNNLFGNNGQSNPLSSLFSPQNNGQNSAGGGGQFRRYLNGNATSSDTNPAPQYLGDLTANSPLPFSISLQNLRAIPGSSFPVTLKISYKDNLRNSHEFVASGNAVVSAPQTANVPLGERGRNSGGDLLLLMMIIGAAIGVAVAAFLVIRKKKHAKAAKKKLNAPNNGADKRTNIEDILENPATDTATKDDRPL